MVRGYDCTMSENLPEYMKVAEFAELFQISRWTVHRYAVKHGVQFIALPSGHKRYLRADVVELYRSKQNPPERVRGIAS